MSAMSWIPCPSCGQDLPPQQPACPHCGLTLTGMDAARLWQVDQQLAALQHERSTLLHRLRQPAAAAVGSAAPAFPAAPALPAEPPPLLAGPPAAAPVARAARRAWTTQQTLLAIGVLLVLVASSLGLAIAWFVIGPYGQVVVMAGLTTLAAFASFELSKRSLASSAEALALVCGGLLLLDVAAARRMDLFALGSLDARPYAAVTGLLAAVALAWLHQRDRRIAAFALLSLAAASIGWGGVVALADDTYAGGAALALVGAAGFGLLRWRLPDSLGLVRRAAGGPAAAWAVVALVLGWVGAFAPSVDADLGTLTTDGVLSVVTLAVLTLGAVEVVRRVVLVRAGAAGSVVAVKADWRARALTGDWRALGVLVLVATVAVPVAVTGLALQVDAIGTALLACLVGLAAIALLTFEPWGRGVRGWWATGQAALALTLLVASAGALESQPAVAVTLTVAALVAGVAAVLRRPWRAVASAVATSAGVGALATATDLVSPTTQVVALTVAGLALVGAALARPGEPEEPAVGAVGVLTALTAVGLALAPDRSTALLITTLVALTACSSAAAVLRPGVLRPLAAGGAATAATWALWLCGDVTTPALQLTFTALAAVLWTALAVWRRGRPEEAVLGVAGLVVALLAVGTALVRDWPHVATALATAYGLVAVAYAALPRRRAVVVLAVAALTGAAWWELTLADVATVEAYTLSLAALVLAAGLWSHRELSRVTRTASWLSAGPGLATALLPSALLTAVLDNPLRVAFAVLGGGIVLALGAWQRWQALVVVGAAACGLVGFTQLAPIVARMPNSLVIGAVGITLLALGVRYEQRRANARQAVSWLASMT